jgi:hypothetical protein
MNEEQLFNYVKENYIHDLRGTGRFCSFDGYSLNHTAVVELKARRKHYDDMMIERKKYDALLRHAKALRFIAYYVCSTPSGIYMWNLTGLKVPQWFSNETMPKTTAFEDRSVTSKAVGYLSVSTSTRL